MTTTTPAAVPVTAVPALEHDEAMRLAATEAARLLDLVDTLTEEQWSAPTDCPGWTVRDILGHLLGMWKLQSDSTERRRQVSTAAEAAQRSGRVRIDEMTALQVAEHAHLSPEELARALHDAAPVAVAARTAMPAELRAAPYDPGLPGEAEWTFGYLFGVIHTRDPWMHRVDISRAVDRPLTLTPEHDGRLVADVVAEWARRHGQPFTLHLTGPAGGRYVAGAGEPEIALDAVEFCRILSGRGEGDGLLATRVPF